MANIKVRVGQSNAVKVIAAASGGAAAENATNVIGGIASVSQLSVGEVAGMSGVSTFFGVSEFQKGLTVAGVSTFTGISTSTSTIFGNQLNIAGVSSFTGIVTTFSDVFVGGDLFVADDLVFDEFTARNGNITGILTAATSNVTGTLTAATANVTGTLTAGLIDGGSF
jgi:cytoskeletal protein CcmA (bactofilin family)|tara:strand:+ start:54 stop:557 length:504 start_codon:yes stop_codon:yes gene_type:complete